MNLICSMPLQNWLDEDHELHEEALRAENIGEAEGGLCRQGRAGRR